MLKLTQIFMQINKNLKLILRDVYLFDIEACHYTIMNKLGLDVSEINYENKIERNIKIGKMMRKNPRLTSLLRNTTQSIITEYIRENKITEDELVIRQYDGILTTKILKVNNIGGIPFNLRKHFLIFIMSIDRKKYIAIDTHKKVTIKGIPFRNEKIDSVYSQLCTDVLNTASKKMIFIKLQRIKDYILSSNDPILFGIPIKDNRVNVYLKGYGEMVVSFQTLKIMDPDDIDKERYFKYYLEPFTKSIVIENI